MVLRLPTLAFSHFAKSHGLLKSGERIENGILGLGNLVHVKSTIQVAGHLVQTVIRTKFTDVLMRRPKSGASPWIACNVLVNKLSDPEEDYHTQVLRNTKRHFCRARASEISAFNSALHEHDGRYAKIHGPVGVSNARFTGLDGQRHRQETSTQIDWLGLA